MQMRAGHRGAVVDEPTRTVSSHTVVRTMRAVPIAVAVGLCGGCSVNTGLQTVDALVPPAQFLQAQRLGDFVDERWWEEFDDATLNQLMTEVFDRNL